MIRLPIDNRPPIASCGLLPPLNSHYNNFLTHWFTESFANFDSRFSLNLGISHHTPSLYLCLGKFTLQWVLVVYVPNTFVLAF